MMGLNMWERSSIALSLRFGRFQLRIVSRMACADLFETAGLKLMKCFPFRFFDRRGRNV
jgi:hypothetical protein